MFQTAAPLIVTIWRESQLGQSDVVVPGVPLLLLRARSTDLQVICLSGGTPLARGFHSPHASLQPNRAVQARLRRFA